MKPIPVNMRFQKADVRVDRATKFGNPFVTPKDGNRVEVIEKYRGWLWNQIQDGNIKASELMQLAGKRIGCWCSPAPCHADVLANAVMWALNENKHLLPADAQAMLDELLGTEDRSEI